MKTKTFQNSGLPFILLIGFALNAFAGDYKKETKLIPGIVFKSDNKKKDKNPSGKGVLSLTDKSGYVPWPAISIEGHFSNDTIFDAKAEDYFFLHLHANGTFTYSFNYDEREKTTRLDIHIVDGLINGYPVKNVPVISYIEDKDLCLKNIKVAAPSFITPITGTEFTQNTAEDFYNTKQDFPNISIQSITYSIAVNTNDGYIRDKDNIKLEITPKFITTSDNVKILQKINPEPEFYVGDIKHPTAYGKLKYFSHELEAMTVQTADGQAVISLEDSKRENSYSKFVNKWNIDFSDGRVYSGTLNGIGDFIPLLSYEKPNCESFLSMMIALSKINAADIPLYDGTMTYTNGNTEKYIKGVSDTQLEMSINKTPVVIQMKKPGTLLSVISPSELSKVSSLTIVGIMNEADAKVLTELGNNISYLNLKDCIIINSEDKSGVRHCVIPSNFMNGSTVLLEVLLPRTATVISDYGVLCNCPRLKRVIFPPYLEHIGFAAFQNCFSLEEVILPKSLSYIADDGSAKYSCFSGCPNIKKVIFNGSTLSYNTSLFGSAASSLKEIRLPGYRTWSGGYHHAIGYNVSKPLRNKKIYVPENVTSFTGSYNDCEFYFQSAKAPSNSSLKIEKSIIHCPKGSTTSYFSVFGKDNEYIESDFPTMETEKDEYALRYINNQKQLERKLKETKAQKADAEWRRKYGNNAEPCMQCYGTGILNRKVGNTYYPKFCPYCNGSGVVHKK